MIVLNKFSKIIVRGGKIKNLGFRLFQPALSTTSISTPLQTVQPENDFSDKKVTCTEEYRVMHSKQLLGKSPNKKDVKKKENVNVTSFNSIQTYIKHISENLILEISQTAIKKYINPKHFLPS